MPYDAKCEEVARHFLADHPEVDELAPVLAQEIQDSIEIWPEEMEDDDVD
jgi:hypothetical protein